MIDESGGKVSHEEVSSLVQNWNPMTRVFDYDGKIWKFPASWGITSKKSKGMEKPTVQEISTFMQAAQEGLDTNFANDTAQSFFDFYQSKGWVVGKAPMKDWKAAARRWLKENAPKQIKSNGSEKLGSRVTRQNAHDLIAQVARISQSDSGQAGE